MKTCPYCGYTGNLDDATQCRKCESSFAASTLSGSVYKPLLVGPRKAREIRRKALSAVVVGLLIKVYWGGYGPWPTIDSPTLSGIRTWLEPLLVYGGGLVYVVGWVLNWI